MRIETISYLKQHAANLELDEPMIVTQSGKPVYRIESAATAQLRDEGIALLKLMNLAERDIQSGRTYSTDEALAMLDEELSSGVVSVE
ncbi:MAG: type II toxin-antitoxin system Phd/YefM family antitoxin [Algicola sp.]|nr:type II toxin-antitoxin system Phd/YefM family antitoxin [Algicola sp.]